MKSQQRTFVVEFKSARRRSTTRPESIWADTDLKAHVRDAEADAPHLFEPNMVSKTPDQSSELPADSKLETHLNDKAETGDAGQISASLAKAEQTYPPPQDNDPNSGSVSKLRTLLLYGDPQAHRSVGAKRGSIIRLMAQKARPVCDHQLLKSRQLPMS